MVDLKNAKAGSNFANTFLPLFLTQITSTIDCFGKLQKVWKVDRKKRRMVLFSLLKRAKVLLLIDNDALCKSCSFKKLKEIRVPD